jgi:curved DNA-binding protein CbpA
VQGQLGEKLVPDLIREITHKNLSGLLRLSRGKAIKAVFFEAGAPTFAISNLANEQLEHKLLKSGLATFEQIERAKGSLAGKTHRLGPALVEMSVLEDSLMRKLLCEQVMGIILSVFEWTQGDYSFDERIRAAHEVTLDRGAADVLLEGARHAADLQQVADLMVPETSVVIRARSVGSRADSGRLIPLESYILSRIEAPTAVSDVGALSGVGDSDARRAVCALVAAGFLKLADRGNEEEEDIAAREAEETLERIREDVMRQLHFSQSADYYDILGVTRHATSAEIKTAYYHHAKKYHPDRYHQQESGELRAKLEALFALMTQAYDTLSQPAERAAYDERIRKNSGPLNNEPFKAASMTVAAPAPAVSETPAPEEEQVGSSLNKPSNGYPVVNETSPLSPLESDPADVVPTIPKNGPQLPPAQLAELYYQQGRARFERKEYHAAVHLLREAIKFDPSRAPYHYHLGIALIRNPRTRREAEKHLTRAAQLEPFNAQIRVKLGLLYKEAGLTKRADQYFREALKMDPENRIAKREANGGDGAKSKGANGSIWKSDLGSMAKRIFKK